VVALRPLLGQSGKHVLARVFPSLDPELTSSFASGSGSVVIISDTPYAVPSNMTKMSMWCL